MNYSRLWVLATIIAVVLLGGFVLSVPHTRDSGTTLPSENATPNTPAVSLHDSFKKGVHTITGLIEAPNACVTITAEASLTGEAPNNTGILVALFLPEDVGVCLQVPTRVNFTTTVSASAGLPITATVNGMAATTTVS